MQERTIKCECGQTLSRKCKDNTKDSFFYFARLNGWTTDDTCLDLKADEIAIGKCPVCTAVIKLCETVKAVDLMRFPIWKEFKELVIDDLGYDEVFERASEFPEFLNEAKDKNMLNKFLTKAEYDDVKEWLNEKKKYMLPQSFGLYQACCTTCGKIYYVDETFKNSVIFCNKNCFERAAHNHMMERTD